MDLQNSLETMSRGTRHIALLYHMVRIIPPPSMIAVLTLLVDSAS